MNDFSAALNNFQVVQRRAAEKEKESVVRARAGSRGMVSTRCSLDKDCQSLVILLLDDSLNYFTYDVDCTVLLLFTGRWWQCERRAGYI